MKYMLTQIDEQTRSLLDQIEKDFFNKDPIVALKRYDGEFSAVDETVKKYVKILQAR